MLANGRTATDFAAETVDSGTVAVAVGVARTSLPSAWANSEVVAKRADAAVDIAFVTAFSTCSGTLPRTVRRGAAVSVNRFAITADALSPLNGRSPASI